MVMDILLQIGMALVTVFMFLYMHNIPQNAFSKFRAYRTRTAVEAKRHFVRGAQLLTRAQAAAASTTSTAFETAALAKSAVEEADLAISLDPKDAAAHILKALALDLQGFRTSALDSLDAALSPLAAKSLSEGEKADALFKRAEMKIAMSGGEGGQDRVDSAIADLVESVRLKGDNVKAYCVLGECYEKKGLVEKARKSFEEAVGVEPKSVVAQDALARLSSSTST